MKAELISEIGRGLLVFLGVGREDNQADVEYLVDKVLNLRIFPDAQGKFNLSLLETGGALLVVSQFTLWGDCRKGRRPSFSESAPRLWPNPCTICLWKRPVRKGYPWPEDGFRR